MNKCKLCGNKNLKIIKKINKSNIYECKLCKCAFTEKKALSKKNLYEKSKIYCFKDYENTKNNQKKKYLKPISKLKQYLLYGRILDVGAGYGLFSKLLFKSKDYNIEAIEPNLSLDYIKNEKSIIKHKISYNTFLKNYKKKFNCICFLDVIEHFNNCEIILKKTKGILNKNGYLLIQVPNYKSLMARLCKNWSWWMVEDHVYHFSTKSIKNVVEKAGYRVLSMNTYETFYDFKKNLDGNFTDIKNLSLRKLNKGLFYIIFFPLYFLLRRIFWKLGYGGLIYLIAKKDE